MNQAQNKTLPDFSHIKTDNIQHELEQILQQNREKIKALQDQKSPCWETLVEPLDRLTEKLGHYWSRVNHLHSVLNSPELHQAYNDALPALSAYHTDISHNHALYQTLKALRQSDQYKTLTQAQQKSLDNDLRDFKLSGADLNEADKKKHEALSLKLSQLTTDFEQNVLSATDNWFYPVTDSKKLGGIPEHVLQNAKKTAQDKKQEGWAFTLHAHIFVGIMSYADDEDMRRIMYEAYLTRASGKGPLAEKYDNTPIMQQIMQARVEMAQLLGFKNYADYSLATKMANSTEQVLSFLQTLADACFTKAKAEYKELADFAQSHGGPDTLQPWQISYYTEKLRKDRYDFSPEQLRPYFALPAVLNGLFAIASRLYNIDIKPVDAKSIWHKDANCYAIYDRVEQDLNQERPVRAYFYLDPYARTDKRGGAWMDDFSSRVQYSNESPSIPVAFLVCNFSPPIDDNPALLTHDEVVTLFHEFGHGLHHMLTQVNTLGTSGINGVSWDAVELPSQFMENWAYEKPALDLFAKHYQTGEALPDDLFEKMQKARNFQSAMRMMRQLEFSLFDFKLHVEFDPKQDNQIQKIIDQIRQKTRVFPAADYDCFQNSFSHIFAGGYAAGYYSYKWAEVMAADAFENFKQSELFSKKYSEKFLQCILEKGGSEEAAELFRQYQGRDAKVEALLKQEGII